MWHISLSISCRSLRERGDSTERNMGGGGLMGKESFVLGTGLWCLYHCFQELLVLHTPPHLPATQQVLQTLKYHLSVSVQNLVLVT